MKNKSMPTREKRRYAIKKVAGKTTSVFVGATLFGLLLGANATLDKASADTVAQEDNASTVSSVDSKLTDSEVTLNGTSSNTEATTNNSEKVENATNTSDVAAVNNENTETNVNNQTAEDTTKVESNENNTAATETVVNKAAAPVAPATMSARSAVVNTENTTPTYENQNNQLAKEHGFTSADNNGSNIYQGTDGEWYKVIFENGENKIYKIADITASANDGLPESWVRENIVINKEDKGNGKTHWTVVYFPNKGLSKNGNANGLVNAPFAFMLTKDYQVDGDITVTIDTDTSKNSKQSYTTDRDPYGDLPVEHHVVQSFNPKTDIDETGKVNSATLPDSWTNDYLQGVYYITSEQYNNRKDIENIFFNSHPVDKDYNGKTYNGNNRSIYANNDVKIRSGEVQGGGPVGKFLIHDNYFSGFNFNTNGAFSSLDFGTLVSLKSWGAGSIIAWKDYSQHSTFTIEFDTTHSDEYQADLSGNIANEYSNGGTQFSGLLAGFATSQNGGWWDGFLASGEQRVGKPNANGKWSPVVAEDIIDNFVNPDQAQNLFNPKYLNNAQEEAIRDKISNAGTQEAMNQFLEEGNNLDEAMKNLGQSVGVYGGEPSHAVATTRNSDKYVYADEGLKNAYDQAAIEATKALSKNGGANLSQAEVEALTKKVNDAWNALNGEKPTDPDKAADKATFESKNPEVTWGEEAPSAKDAVTISNLPDGVTVVSQEWVTVPDTKPDMAGAESEDVPATVHVKFSDGSERDVAVNVKVNSLSSKYDPKAVNPVPEYDLHATIKPEDLIGNKDELPKNARYEWANQSGTIDSIKPGSKNGLVKVIYEDGSSDVVTVFATVKNGNGSLSQGSLSDITTQIQEVEYGTPADSIDLSKSIDTAKSTGLENQSGAPY